MNVATSAALLLSRPLPPCGGGTGRGASQYRLSRNITPLPNPPPQGGREQRARAG